MATAGGLVVAGLGSLIGYQITDMGDRYIAGYANPTTPAPTLPAGITSIAQYNDAVVSAKPSLARIGWGIGMMVLGFGGGAMVPWATMKMFLYGWGLGATAHLGGQLLNGYVVEPMFMTAGVASSNGSRMFQHEIHSNNLLTPPAGAAPGTLTGLGSPPAMQSARGTPIAALGPAGRTLPNMQPVARMPAALASARHGNGALGQSNPPFVYVPEGYVPPSVSPNPPAAPAPTPGGAPTYPPNPAPPPLGGCAPCAPSGPTCACTGTSQCSCGQCGMPPDEASKPYRHPLFRTMQQTRSSQRRAA